MKGFTLSTIELEELRAAHKLAKRTNANVAYRINAVILLGTNWTLKKVKKALLLDEDTLSCYVKSYQEEGVDGLLKTNHSGRSSNLNFEQQELLCEELDKNIHLTTYSVIEYVKENYGITALPKKNGLLEQIFGLRARQIL